MKRFLVSKDENDGKKAKGNETTGLAAPSVDLHVVTYNVDGLCETHLEGRTTRVIELLLPENAPRPDVVMLQEVIPDTAPLFVSSFISAGYQCCPPEVPDLPYFTLLFTKTATVTVNAQDRKPFGSSKMMRDLTEASATFHPLPPSSPQDDDNRKKSSDEPEAEAEEEEAGKGEAKTDEAKKRERGVKLLLLTSHLESCKNGSGERCRQLSTVLGRLSGFNNGVAIFGGDTNLREAEVSKAAGYRSVIDAWEAAGSDADRKYTWDLQKNDNLVMPGPSQPRMRLDRLLVGKGVKGVQVHSYELLGTQRIPGLVRDL